MAGKEYKFEDFLHLTVTSLQDFLSLRALSKSGKKDELVARAFRAYELKNTSSNFNTESLRNYFCGGNTSRDENISLTVKLDAAAILNRNNDSPQSIRVFSPTYKMAATTVKPSITVYKHCV